MAERSNRRLGDPGSKCGARHRSFYEDLGRADIHLGQGSSQRPDTLMQTDIANSSHACGRGGPYVLEASSFDPRAVTASQPEAIKLTPQLNGQRISNSDH